MKEKSELVMQIEELNEVKEQVGTRHLKAVGQSVSQSVSQSVCKSVCL